jgi:hypothetical protein
MKNVYFQPWEGMNYHKSKNNRLLVLGESHYYPGVAPKGFTNELIGDYTKCEWSHRYWTNIMQVIEGKKHSEIDRVAFWSRIAFYNYVQEIVSDCPGVAPSSKMWQRAEGPFFQVLDHLKPSHVLALSKRLWDSMSSKGKSGKMLKVKDITRDTWIFNYQGGSAFATWLRHPSYGFSYEEWHPLVRAFLSN